MSSDKLAQFANQKYLSLETYKKDGTGVPTPLWFAQEGRVFYVYTLAGAWKVKRIRNNPRARIAPCDVRGKIKGEWVDAEARILDQSEASKVHRLLDKKYGWQKMIGNFISKLRKLERVTIAIQVK
ncbi:MAG TPA: PPOX class F420-dependent oxidoreductase [Blastocatellia bacterium]|nr:PPOX class F420-dependent oxidoreductase [Blastocatellia bacterium]